jgi:hypothetical protein
MFEAMIDPTAGPASAATGSRRAARPSRLAGLTVGLLANTSTCPWCWPRGTG